MFAKLRKTRPYVLLFVALSLIYHSNLRPIATGDSLPTSLIPYAILIDHTVTLDRFGPWIQDHVYYNSRVMEKVRGHWYSLYPIGGPVLVTPLYLPVLAFPSLRNQSPETLIAIARITEKFVAVILAATAAVLMLVLLEGVVSQPWAWGLTLVFALCTATWSISSQALWQHTFGPVAIIISLFGLSRWETSAPGNRWLWLGGAGAGLAVLIRPMNAWLVLALMVALWFRRPAIRDYVRVLVPVLLLTAPELVYNWMVFQRLTGRYTWDGGNFFSGMAGLLVSPGRGLLMHEPILFFALLALAPAARASRRKHRALLTACVVFALLHFLMIAKWRTWWGGFCWGPRYLTEMIPCLIVLIAIGVPALQTRRWKVAFASIAVYCGLVQALGVYFYPNGRWDRLPVSVDRHEERVWNWVDNPIIRTARGGPVWQPYVIVATAFTKGLPAAAAKLKQYGINSF